MMSKLLKFTGCALLALVCMLPGAQAADASAQKMTIPAIISGSVSYREHSALPAGSEAIIQLHETTQANAPAKLIAEQRIAVSGPAPVAYQLDYDAVNINPRNTYQVSARIMNGKKTLFVTDTPIPVITRGSPGHVDLVLSKAGTK
jgi:putative lipoprotein